MIALRYAGYAVFFLFAFIIGLYWTFPFDAAKDRLLGIASKETKMQISARSLEPSWVTGAVAKGVKIQRPGNAAPIEIPRVDARAHILPLLTGGKAIRSTYRSRRATCTPIS